MYLISKLNFGAMNISVPKLLVLPVSGDMYILFGAQTVCFYVPMNYWQQVVLQSRYFCKTRMPVNFEGVKWKFDVKLKTYHYCYNATTQTPGINSLKKLHHRLYWVSPKKVTCLIDHRTKGFCSIIKILFYFNQEHFNSDLETKFAQIR